MQLQLDLEFEDEATLLKLTKAWLEAQPDILVMRINDRYAKGYSDVFTCVNGIFCAIELKDNTGKASPHQLLFIKNVIEKGGVAGVAKTLREVMQLVDKARKIR